MLLGFFYELNRYCLHDKMGVSPYMIFRFTNYFCACFYPNLKTRSMLSINLINNQISSCIHDVQTMANQAVQPFFLFIHFFKSEILLTQINLWFADRLCVYKKLRIENLDQSPS